MYNWASHFIRYCTTLRAEHRQDADKFISNEILTNAKWEQTDMHRERSGYWIPSSPKTRCFFFGGWDGGKHFLSDLNCISERTLEMVKNIALGFPGDGITWKHWDQTYAALSIRCHSTWAHLISYVKRHVLQLVLIEFVLLKQPGGCEESQHIDVHPDNLCGSQMLKSLQWTLELLYDVKENIYTP